jgi:hypothetical protein
MQLPVIYFPVRVRAHDPIMEGSFPRAIPAKNRPFIILVLLLNRVVGEVLGRI